MEAARYATLGILGVGGILAAFGLAGTVHAQISDWEYLDIAIDLTERTRGPYVDGTDLLILTLEVTNNADGMARVDGASVSLRIQDGDDHLRYGRTPWPTGPMAESCPADIRPVGAGLTETWNVCFLIPEGLEPDFLGIIHSDPDAGHIAQFDSGQDASCLDTYYDILCAPYALDGGVTIPDFCRFDYFAETWTCDDAQGDDIVETAGLRSRADCSRFDALGKASEIAVAEISGRTYAFVAAPFDDGVQVIDVTDPASPVPASSVFDGQDGFDALAGANGVTVAEISSRTYALATATYDGSVQVIDVTDPASPVPASSVFYGDAVAAAGRDDTAGGGVVVSYREADDPIHYGLRSWLADNEDIIIDADSVACYLDLPRDVSVVFEACGEANAWYSSATGDITMCYELADRYTGIFRQFSSDSAPLAVAGSLHWVFMHELGHAVIDAYDLPITGQEEDSADQFAAMMLLEEGRWGAGALLSAAYVYGSAPGYTPYWDTHSLNYQRHYDMLCLLYGKHHDNEIGWQAADLIPESRAARCPGEYLDAVNAWNALLPATDNSR